MRSSPVPSLHGMIFCALLAACSDGPADLSPRVALLAINSGDLQVSSAGGSLAQPLAVIALDGNGAPVQGARIVWTADDGGSVEPAATTTSGSGLATTVRTLGANAGTYRTTATLDDGSARVVRFRSIAQIQGALEMAADQFSNGDGQIGGVSEQLAPFRVLVRDAFGAPATGVRVEWSIAEGGGTLSASSSLTGIDGVAQMVYTLPAQTGPATVQAAVQGLVGSPVRFRVAAQVLPPRISIVSGNNQTDSVSTTLAPFVVVVKTRGGQPVSGVTVNWTLRFGLGSLSAAATPTDQSGVAQVTFSVGQSGVGRIEVEAFAPDVTGSPVSFVATARPGNPVTLLPFGDYQVGMIGTELREYRAVVQDAYGNRVEHAQITWSVLSGGGSVRTLPGGAAYHTLGPFDGPQTVSARLSNGASATFTATAVTALGYVNNDARAFQPGDIRVPSGKTVGWQWICSDWYYYYCETHNIVFEDDTRTPPSSPTLLVGEHARRFDHPPGTVVRYRCTHHSASFTDGMVGVVRIE